MQPRTRRRPRRLASAAAALLVMTSFAAPAALADETTDPGTDDSAAVTRFAGENRYDTSKDFAARGIGAAQSAIVTTGENFPDALAGAYLAGNAVGPVVLTPPTTLATEARDAIAALTSNAGWSGVVYVLGGPNAVSEDVVDAIEAISGVDEVVRISGDDRFATAVAVARAVPGTSNPTNAQSAAQVGEIDGMKAAILATGRNFPDALVAGVLSRQGNIPILLTQPDAVPAVTAQALADLGIEKVVLAGGTAVISEDVRTDLEGDGFTVERVSGDDRHETAVEFAQYIDDKLPGFDTTGRVGLALGYNFPDALSMAPFAGGPGRFPILLTRPDGLDAFTQAELQRRATNDFELFVAGGTAVVPESVADAGAEAGETDGAPEPVEGEVSTTSDGTDVGTLRAAVIYANGEAGAQTIELESGRTYTLSVAGTGEDAAATGDLDVTGDLTIQGNGATIDADGIDRVFDVLGGAELTLDDVVVTGGDTPESDGREGFGGGVRVESGSLVMTDGAVNGNTAAKAGGGIEVASSQTATLTDVDMSGNAATGNGAATAANGGAVHSTGDVDVTGGTVRENIANEEGGGFWQGAGTMTVDGTDFYANEAKGGFTAGDPQGGGALFVIDGTLDVANAEIGTTGDGNQAQTGTGSGGAILVDDATLTLATSTVGFNAADRAGGAIEVFNDGADLTPSTVTIEGSLFRGNGALGDDGPGNGGVLHVTGPGDVTIRGSFFTFNDAANEGGALWNGTGTMRVETSSFEDNAAPKGAAMFNDGSFLNVVNSTISDTANGSGVLPLIENAGVQTTLQFVTVFSTDTAAATTLVNSNPTQPAYGSFTVGNSILNASCDTEISSAGDNVTSDGGCLFGGGEASDVQGVDPMVSALTSTNGGPAAGKPGSTFPAKVHQIQPGSPAIDIATSGNISLGDTGLEPAPTEDQRGQSRPVNGDGAGGAGNDSGAYEFVP